MPLSNQPPRWVGLVALALSLAAPAVAQEPEPYGDLGDLKVARPEDRLNAPPLRPKEGAIVLFDGRGKSLDQWVKTDRKSAPAWKLVEGDAMQVTPGGGNIITRQDFGGHFLLHLEFRVPYLPKAKGQARGNSGVYLQGRYEVQVLDSYGHDSRDNDCGAIYEVAAPKVNACKAPTVWQSYDIDFRAPRFADGKKVEPARISVSQNGVPIHEDVAINVDNTRAGLGGDPGQPGPIMLQDHGNPVQFRNIWLLPVAP